jgi:ABC-type multidrug transport system ATPase subunit
LPAGSGKSSLLDVIARRTEGEVEGSVTLHHQPLSLQAFRAHAGYVIQADRLLPNLSVQETLEYTARLKFLGQCDHEEIQNMVGTLYMVSAENRKGSNSI